MKTKNVFAFWLTVFFLIGSLNISLAQKSTGWRGVNGDNKVEGFKIPAKWPAQLKNAWQVKVGESDGSPVIVEGKIFLHVKQEGNEIALCINASDGKEVWKTTLNPSPDITGPAIGHPGPRSTPAVADGRLFTNSAAGIVNCIDATTGKVIWKNDAYNEVPQFYASSSPLVVGKMVVFQLGGKQNGAVVAFDVNTGKEIWKLVGIPTTYSSPVLMKSNKDMLLVQSETDLCGITTAGKLLWKIPCPTQQRFYNSNSPVYEGQNIFIPGQGIGTRMLNLTRQGENCEAKELWSNKELGVSFNTPVIKDGFLYGFEAKTGYIFCLNAKTGEKAWTDATLHNRFATIIDAGKVLVALPASGNLIIFEPNGKAYSELAKYKVADGETYSFPALDGNKIYIKDRETLTCWLLE